MMRLDLTIRQHARITLETTAPLSIGAGRSDGVFDVVVARDVNDLPFLPGTALAGVLRSAWRDHFGDDPVELFGAIELKASRVTLTNGRIHNNQDIPVDGLVYERNSLFDDSLLGPLLNNDLPHRDHVALDHKGSARNRGKFDRTYVPVGHRFTFDISLESNRSLNRGDQEWLQLIALLNSPGFRLGGATRRAYGAFKIVRVLAGEFDLATTEGRKDFSSVSTRLDARSESLRPLTLPELEGAAGWQEIAINLQPDDFWRAGNGGHSFSKQKKLPDALPYSERRVIWSNGIGALNQEPEILLPGSSIKGALAHRLAFHYRRLVKNFSGPASKECAATQCAAVEALFGCVNDEGGGQAGHVLVDDIRLNPAELNFAVMQHTSVDRFTGGVRQGVLYSEELIAGKSIRLRLVVRQKAIELLNEEQRQHVVGALQSTLEDLCEGRLALGAAQAKGHGFFTGVIESAPQWLLEE